MEPQLFSFELHFEQTLQKATYLHNAPSLDTQPFEYKYKARKLLTKLKEDLQNK
jgi:hypothetical protein